MPAASYREGPDGHSSRKQNSKRRRAKCSPSFVSGRVIGHGDIPPRCVPECSAMALHRAVPPLLIPAAPELCLSCFWRGDALQFLPSAPFFLRGGRQLFGAGESRRSSMARSSRMRSRATGSGNILARCVPGRSTMAKCSRNAFPSVRRWRDCALMRPWPDWQWQYSRAMRSRVPCRGKIPPRCVPGRQSVASFALHASRKRPRTGKSPVRGKIRTPRIRKRAGSGKICVPCIRKALQTAVWEYTARRSCHEGAAFAARAPRITHGAQILPSGVAKPPERPQPRRRRTARAARARSPDPRNAAQEAAPPVASWAASTASSSRGTATALCQHQPVACRPGEQLRHCRQRLLWRQHPRRHRPADSPSCARPKEGYLPYLWRLSSVLLADAIGL